MAGRRRSSDEREAPSAASFGDGEAVDPRLDNRTGAQRPKVEEWPAKPQQVDGPDLVHQAEHTKATAHGHNQEGDDTPRKGMFSPGPHGLSDPSVRGGGKEGDGPLYGTEGLTEDEAAAGKPDKDNTSGKDVDSGSAPK